MVLEAWTLIGACVQMLSWTSAALLLTAAGVHANPWPRFNAQCGDLMWPCCDIPENDPNGGLCRDDTLMTCWEGTCKRCGTDGMPICAGAVSPAMPPPPPPLGPATRASI